MGSIRIAYLMNLFVDLSAGTCFISHSRFRVFKDDLKFRGDAELVKNVNLQYDKGWRGIGFG